jgi:hypothetical protein
MATGKNFVETLAWLEFFSTEAIPHVNEGSKFTSSDLNSKLSNLHGQYSVPPESITTTTQYEQPGSQAGTCDIQPGTLDLICGLSTLWTVLRAENPV